MVIRVIFLGVCGYWAGQTLPLRDCRQSSFEQRAKGGFIMYSHLGENLAVYIDIGLMNGIDQLAIAHAVHACGGINACNPQAAHIAFGITAGSRNLYRLTHKRFLSVAQQASSPRSFAPPPS